MEQGANEDSKPDMLTVKDVCEKLQIKRWKVNKLRRSGELESVKIGSLRRFPRDAFEEYERKLKEKGG
jgi:excisionase family DNA binding protein